MKKLLLIPILIFALSGFCFADELVLDNDEVEVSPIAKSHIWEAANINLEKKEIVVRYTKINAAGQEIPMKNGRTLRSWTCKNTPDNPESVTADCLGEGDPWPLCTGVATCENDCKETDFDLCWTNVFMFSVRQQDVGTFIGRGLRNLIKNQMAADGVFGP